MFGSPGSRPQRGALTQEFYAKPLYAGSRTPTTYDPGVGVTTLTGCSITVPPLPFAQVYMVFANWNGTTFTNTHGVRSSIQLDGVTVGATQGWALPSSQNGEGAFCALGPTPITVPGDGKSHTISLAVSDSGATGNLTFNDRWITATPVSP
jgi:hypothetical protein